MKRITIILLFSFVAAIASVVTSTSTPPEGEIDSTAEHMLKEMSRKLAAAKQVSFHIDATADLVDENGIVYEVARSMEVALRRPNRITMQMRGVEGNRGFRYDGKNAFLYHIDFEFYSTVKAGRSIDATLDMLWDDYDFVFPFADLIHSDPYEMLMDGVEEAYDLGWGSVDGVTCRHLLFRQPGADWQIWIEDSVWQYPRKFVMVDTDIEGMPRYSATFSDWDYGAELSDALFEFNPPEQAKKIRWAKVSQ